MQQSFPAIPAEPTDFYAEHHPDDCDALALAKMHAKYSALRSAVVNAMAEGAINTDHPATVRICEAMDETR